MPRIEVSVAAPDGACPATLHVPDSGTPAPGVIFYADAPGVRETLRLMADRLSSSGYVVLVPDVYYRAGDWAPFDLATVFSDPPERDRMKSMTAGLTADMIDRDAGAFLDFLLARPEVSGSTVGITGYCMGGRAAMLVAGRHPERVAAAGSFHGGRLAVTDDPGSPHLTADRITAAVCVGAAKDDDSFPAEQFDRLERIFVDAGVRYTMDTYDARHGFAVPDHPAHDQAAEDRHWTAVTALFEANLPR